MQTVLFSHFSRNKVSNQIKIKEENISNASDIIIGGSKPVRAGRKKINVIRCYPAQDQTTSNQDNVQVKAEAIITEMDTADSLREKFPKASPFEFEFLMFLKGDRK